MLYNLPVEMQVHFRVFSYFHKLFRSSSIILLELQNMFKLKIPAKPQHVSNPNFSFIHSCNWVISEEHKVLLFLNKLTGQQAYFCYVKTLTNFYREFNYYMQSLLGIIALYQDFLETRAFLKF